LQKRPIILRSLLNEREKEMQVTCIYGVATISRILKIIGLFCRISSLIQGSFAKEIYNFKEPTKREKKSDAGHLHIWDGYD